MRRARLHWIVVLAAAWLGGRAIAADQFLAMKLRDSRRSRDVPIGIWIPGGVKVLRGAICQGLYEDLVRRSGYQMLARSLESALIGASMRKSEHLLPSALRAFAEKSGHPEIEHFPLVTMGFSAGGGVAIKLAAMFPERGGWLGDIATWSGNWATIRPFSEEQVARETAAWLLDEYVAHTWRAFVAKEPNVEVAVEPDAAAKGGHLVRAEGALPPDLREVELYAGSVLLGSAATAPYQARTTRIARGVHSIFTVCIHGDGRRTATLPVLRVDGEDPKREEAERAAHRK